MDKLLIRGGRTLNGEVSIAGAKNAALPEICAALLSAEPLTLLNVPSLKDVSTMLKLLRNMGVKADLNGDGTLVLDAGEITSPEAPYELVKTMRDTYGVTIAGGQAELKGKVFRIAHMGFIAEFDIITGLSCLEKVLAQMGYKFTLGAGIKAAEEVFLK